MKKLLLLLPLVLIVFSSGCTGICIPGIPGLDCGDTVTNKETADILVFERVIAVPNTISPGQTVRVIAYVKNLIDEPMEFEIQLYDYCEGLFGISEGSKITCGGVEENPDNLIPEDSNKPTEKIIGCKNVVVYGKQIMPITWTLNSDVNLKLQAKCEPKIRIKYEKSSQSLTSIMFVTPDELRRRLEEGLTEQIKSEVTIGTGPIRTYFEVEDQQPIPTDAGKTAISLNIVNEGKGYLEENKIYLEKISVFAGVSKQNNEGINGKITTELEECAKRWGTGTSPDKYIQIIGKQNVKLVCSFDIPDELDNKEEAQVYLSVVLSDYVYEIRGDTIVTIEPPIIS